MKFRRGKPVLRSSHTSKEPSFYNSSEWKALSRAAKDRDNWTCQRCGKPARTPEQRRWMEAHHVEYRSKGGADHINNLKTLCWSCHQLHEHGRKRRMP